MNIKFSKKKKNGFLLAFILLVCASERNPFYQFSASLVKIVCMSLSTNRLNILVQYNIRSIPNIYLTLRALCYGIASDGVSKYTHYKSELVENPCGECKERERE